MKSFQPLLLPLLLSSVFPSSTLSLSTNYSSSLKNVLFIVSDDFRPDTGAYGNEFASTPHLDRLASEGLVRDVCSSDYVVDSLWNVEDHSLLSHQYD